MPTIFRGDESYDVPERLPVLPLRDVVLFPYMVIPLLVGRQASLAAVESALAADRWVFLVAQRNGEIQEPAASQLYRVGVIGRVLQISRLPNGTTKVLLEGVARARVTRYAPTDALLRATIVPAPFVEWRADDAEADAMARRVTSLFEEYVGLHRRLPPEVVALVQGSESRDRLAFATAAHLQVRHSLRQQLLESESCPALIERLVAMLTSEIEILRLERKI
jgi:ATP-dependent Lon protease